jgi:hypothetical protein
LRGEETSPDEKDSADEETSPTRKHRRRRNIADEETSPTKKHRRRRNIADEETSIVTEDKSESWNDLDATHTAARDACRPVARQALAGQSVSG